MKNRIQNKIAVWTVVALVVLSPLPVQAAQKSKAFDLQQTMRKLWEDHVTWTRLYIVSALAGLPDTGATAQRLLQNQTDIGTAIKSFYGEEAGNKLSGLLKDHILIAADLIAAAKAGEKAKQDNAAKRWDANADEIAGLLSSANPQNWPLREMKSMMREHLNFTTAEVAARLHEDWTADVAAYERIHEQILHMADMLSNGIVRQFSKKFE